MANFPIQPVRQFDTSNMIVNWAGAGDKILRGISEGIQLGLKIKDSKQNALLAAAHIRESDNAVAMKQIEVGLQQKDTASRLALQEEQRKSMILKNAYEGNALTLAAQDAQSRAQLAQSQNIVQSNLLVADMAQMSNDPDVIRARQLIQSLPAASADPVKMLQITNELQQLWEDEGSGVVAYDERQKEFQARNPTSKLADELAMPDMNALYAMLDNPRGGYGIKTGMMVRKTITVTDPNTGEPKQTTIEEPEVLTISEYTRRLQSDPTIVKRAVEDSRPYNRAANVAWLKKNVASDTLKLAGVKDVFPGTEQEWQATQKPAIPTATPMSPDVLSGKKVVVNGLEMNRPTGIFSEIIAKIRAGTTMDFLRANSPTGTFGKVLDAQERAQDVAYWENTKKALVDTQATQPADERAKTQLLLENVKDELTKKYKIYGITPPTASTPDASAKDVAGKIHVGNGDSRRRKTRRIQPL